ncbi:hypothetical protein PRIPAC_96378 [Pristionchus pacificus]|uniref:Ribosomal protein n=1 Tax=Pristionchus pacificus TaxID=54126 RepID=A0A2A6BCN4_PRIPA|nr:hypothetical protein PRIPAC_96378 [Pristionchus pacificus]|eukprot:PDM63649.1 ribosomal protein [Pristionchus pacificus]
MAVGGHTATSRDEPCSSHFSLRIYIFIVTRKIIGFAVSGRHVSSFPLSRPFSNGLELIRSQHLPQQLRQFFRKRHPQGSQVEALKWVDKSENGKGRILSKQGRKDLDRIAADLRSTAAPAEL